MKHYFKLFWYYTYTSYYYIRIYSAIFVISEIIFHRTHYFFIFIFLKG